MVEPGKQLDGVSVRGSWLERNAAEGSKMLVFSVEGLAAVGSSVLSLSLVSSIAPLVAAVSSVLSVSFDLRVGADW